MLLEQYLNGKHYPSKQARVDQIDQSIIEDTVFEVIQMMPGDTGTIQEVATRLGYKLGFNDQLEAVKTGAEVLAVTQSPELFTIAPTAGGRMLVERNPELTLLAPYEKDNYPTTKPLTWDKDNKKKCILGHHFKRHMNYQAIDVLNILNNIPCVLDPHVLQYESRNKPYKYAPSQEEANIVNAHYKNLVFYFLWRFCTRGRMYAHSWYLNPQGTEYCKALINPARAEYVTDLRPLKIAVANAEGYDKLTWAERINTFDSCTKPKTILGRKAMRAYARAKAGLPINFYMELDATASGLQMMAIMLGCKQTARHCNLTNTGRREDLYTHVMEEMNRNLDPEDHVTREMVKDPVMTHFYNSLAGPAKSLNDSQHPAFLQAVTKMFPGATDVMDTINAFWNPRATHHSWTLPDGHHAIVPVTEQYSSRVEVDELNNHRFTYIYERVQPSKRYTSLAPNVVHSIDAYVAREMVRRAPCDLLPVHDAFFFPPNHMRAVQKLYRTILAELADSNIFADILSDIAGEPITLSKTSLAEDIKASEYAIS